MARPRLCRHARVRHPPTRLTVENLFAHEAACLALAASPSILVCPLCLLKEHIGPAPVPNDDDDALCRCSGRRIDRLEACFRTVESTEGGDVFSVAIAPQVRSNVQGRAKAMMSDIGGECRCRLFRGGSPSVHHGPRNATLRELGRGRAKSLCLAQGEERGRLTIHDGGAKVNIKDRRKGTQVTYHRHRSNSLYTPEEIRSCPCPSRGRGSPRGLHRRSQIPLDFRATQKNYFLRM